MCGIAGHVGADAAGEIVQQGLKNLEYRGYDSAGIALSAESLAVQKTEGEVDELPVPSETDVTAGIGHTRWSTHGEPTKANAHPHTDCTGAVAVVHNGIIENYDEFRADLRDRHIFESETDTEVIPYLLEDHLADGVSLRTAVQRTTEQLVGSYAIAVTASGQEGAVVARRDSPLLVGHADDATFIGSDARAFIEYTNRVTYLQSGDIAQLTADGIEIYNDGERVERDTETLEWDADVAELPRLDVGVSFPDHLLGVVEVTGCGRVPEGPNEDLSYLSVRCVVRGSRVSGGRFRSLRPRSGAGGSSGRRRS